MKNRIVISSMAASVIGAVALISWLSLGTADAKARRFVTLSSTSVQPQEFQAVAEVQPSAPSGKFDRASVKDDARFDPVLNIDSQVKSVVDLVLRKKNIARR